MDELIQAMSIPELQKFKGQYSDNDSIVKIVDGYIEVKQKQVAQEKAKADFTRVIARLINKLPHPNDVHNVYMRWAEVEVEDTSGEPEMVNITTKEAVLDKDGSVIESAVSEEQPRYPKHMEYQWVVELNKGFRVGAGATGEASVSKRAVTLNKRDGQQLTFVGNFPSASKACEHLKIALGGDSATRVLNREGYILDPYTGTDYTSS